MTELVGKDRRALRALGHHLKPVVQIGQHGITEALVAAAEKALSDHELIKVKVLESSPIERREAAAELAGKTGSELAQVLGRTFLLFKANPEKGTIDLPRAGRPPTAALHGHVGGEGDRPAARLPKRALTQGAKGEGAPGRGAAKAKGPGRRVPGKTESAERTFDERKSAKLPPRRHGR